jgi:hypothetical protein
MKYLTRSVLTLVFVAGAIQVSSPQAMAQFGGDRIKRPFGRPTVSPYLNLLRGGSASNSVLNYYGSVRPQNQFYNQDARLSDNVNDLRQQGYRRPQWNRNDGNKSFRRYRMGITGHPAGFMTIGRGGPGGGDEGGGGGSSFGGDDEQSSGGRSGHSASFGSSSFGSGSFGSGNSGSRF